MKVLFISFHYPPYNCIGAVRVSKMSKYLVEKGHDVKVITANNQNLPETLPLEISKEKVFYTKWLDINSPIYFLLGKNKTNKIKGSINSNNRKTKIVSKIKDIYKYCFHIPDQNIGWYYYAIKQYEELINNEWKPDIIFSSALPYTSHLVASKISKKYDIPWVAELRDLWVDNHYRNSNFIDKILEKNTLSNTDALISVSAPLTNTLSNKFDKPSYTIQNGFDQEYFLEENKNHKKIKIIYTGSLYEGKRTPELLFKALKKYSFLQDSIEVEFYGRNLDWVNSLAKDYELKNIFVGGEVSYEEALMLQKKSDILLLLTWDNPKEVGVLTGKFFEYIATKKPILLLGATDDILAQIIKKEKFGIVASSEEEIKTFLNENTYKNYRYGSNEIKKYSREYQLKLFEEILFNTLKERNIND